MKLHCHRPSLATALQVVSGVVPARTPKDILKNVKLQVADGRATLIGTDQEIGIRYEIAGIETDSVGETLLPVSRVIAILREIQEDDVHFEVTADAVWIRAGHSEFRLSAEDPAEFPPVTPFEEEQYHSVSAQTFKEMICRTAFATDVESTRYALGGVLLQLEPATITMAATDSRRLALTKSSCRCEGEGHLENNRPIVPSKAMLLAERSISDADEDLFIAVHANDLLIKCSNFTIYSRLVEGRFPQYNSVIPTESNVTIDLVVGPFYSLVRQAQIVTDEESRGVDFSFSHGLLTLNSKAADVGQSKVELPISYDYAELTITFDPRFVAEFLRVLKPEKQVKLQLIDGESAAVFRTEDSYTYVIMPLSRDH